METPQILVVSNSIRDIDICIFRVVISIVDKSESDNRISECAIEARTEYIVPGDEHLLSPGRYDEVSVVSASRFLNIYQSQTNMSVD